MSQDLPTTLPSSTEIGQRIEQLRSDDTLEAAARDDALKRLELALTQREEIDRLRDEIARYSAAMSNAPDEVATINSTVNRFVATDLPAGLEAASLSEIERALSEAELEVAARRRELSEISTQLRTEKAFDIDKALAGARDDMARANSAHFDGASGASAPSLGAGVALHLYEMRVSALEQRRLSRAARLSVLNAREELLKRELDAAQGRLSAIRTLAAEHRQNDAERRAEAARETLALLKSEPAPIRAVAAEVSEHARALSTIVARHELVTNELDRTTRAVSRLRQRFDNLNAQLNFARLEPSPEFGAALRSQRDNLVNVDDANRRLERFEQALADTRLEQFRLDSVRDSEPAERTVRTLASLIEDPTITVTPRMRRLVDDLLNDDSELLVELSQAYSEHAEALLRVTGQLRALISQSQDYAQLLDQHLLWLPSAPAVSGATARDLVAGTAWFVNNAMWADALRSALGRIATAWLPVLVWVMVLVGLLRERQRLLVLLQGMQHRVGKVQLDSTRLTMMAFVITLALAAPGPFLMFGLALLLDDSGALTHPLANALHYGAVVYLVLEVVLQSVRASGLAALHFAWDEHVLAALKRNLPWFMTMFIPAVMVNLFLETQGSAAVRDSLGRGAFVLATLVLAAFVYRLSDPVDGLWPVPATPADLPGGPRRRLHAKLLVLIPLLIAALSAYGYHYTALQLDAHLLNSVLVLIGGAYLFHFLQRAYAVGERRLTLERLRARRAADHAAMSERAAANASGDGVPAKLEMAEIDLQTVSTQTRALLKMVVTVAVIISLWQVWADFVPAFKPLDDIVLWDVGEIVDGTAMVAAITLWDLVLAIFVIVITMLAAKNIPGSLEVAVLGRLALEPGTSYAITTVSRYLIVIAGTIFALQIIGAQWSKLQWLVAALSVGLGFGLQEIVANFVSGIVILFERPIRIGDTVTVGDQWGTVSRIRIRATTIVDWDRREVVIPNKTFITERLVNWTLTDPITRAVIKVGIAYGSDVELAERLLLDIAERNPMVLDDPQPVAVFLNFGDSSLDFELRVFVRGVRDLIPVRHDLHMAIDKTFRDNQIEIAFPQRDIHFDSGPIDVRIVRPGISEDD